MSSNPLAYFKIKPSEVVKAVKAILTGAIAISPDTNFTMSVSTNQAFSEGTKAIFMIPTPPLPENECKARLWKLFVEAILVPFEHICRDPDQPRHNERNSPGDCMRHIALNGSARVKGKQEPYGALPSWIDWRKMPFDRLNASCHIWPTHQLPPRHFSYNLWDEMHQWRFVIEVLGDFPSEIPPAPDEPFVSIGPNIQITLH
ncbi:hypothetical protein BT96DRAFT_943208 [Gymnopus androsaceus JB14]|uniref:Uncharacterized protein n=1 Tax=Gymnopus androsaceus JB14 TaxID=1447944 RepID=A0A6A4H818_9AGAR|nr:hypothetical protein BT96DRAFT_943208 [Gymnopus androsaceus JB14]